MAAECTAAAAKVCRSRLPDGSLQVGGGDIRQNMLQRGERVKMVRSQVDVRKEGRKEVSVPAARPPLIPDLRFKDV